MKKFLLLAFILASCSPTNLSSETSTPVDTRSEAEINAEKFQKFFVMRDEFLASLDKINQDQDDFRSLVGEQTTCVEIVEKYNNAASESWWVSLFYANLPLQLPGEKCLKL